MTCTDCHVPPFADAVLAEATRISPHRRGSPYAATLGVQSSDGTCASAAHHARNPNSDHEPSGPNCFCHAVDISQSTPGAPYWDPRCGLFDAHGYGWAIAARMKLGVEHRVKYLVSYINGHDVIFDPAVSMAWRENGTGTEHASHLHVSFTVAAEQSTDPFFAPAAGGMHPAPSPQPGGSGMIIVAHPTNKNAYWCITPKGALYARGGAHYWPEVQQLKFNGPVTSAAATATGNGLYLITAAGSVYTLGDAVYDGGAG